MNTEPRKYEYSLKTAQQQAFLQIFNLHAVDGKIDKQQLREIFIRISFKISKTNFDDLCEKAFGNKQKISFEEFMETFKVKQSSYDLVDIKNAFKLIAGDSDDKIPVAQMKELFLKQGIEEERIAELIQILGSYIDEKKMFNFKLFLSHLK